MDYNYQQQVMPEQQLQQQYPYYQQPIEITEDMLPNKFRPLGAWAYFGWSLLFSIPIVGFILLIVFACGAVENVNLRNYARSFFCLIVIALILVLIGALMATAGIFVFMH